MGLFIHIGKHVFLVFRKAINIHRIDLSNADLAIRNREAFVILIEDLSHRESFK